MNLLAFGGWWALSMTKYYSGRTHPEDDEDERPARHLSQSDAGSGWNFLVALVAFKSSLIESFEVAIKVVGLGLSRPRATLLATFRAPVTRGDRSSDIFLRQRVCRL